MNKQKHDFSPFYIAMASVAFLLWVCLFWILLANGYRMYSALNRLN